MLFRSTSEPGNGPQGKGRGVPICTITSGVLGKASPPKVSLLAKDPLSPRREISAGGKMRDMAYTKFWKILDGSTNRNNSCSYPQKEMEGPEPPIGHQWIPKMD